MRETGAIALAALLLLTAAAPAVGQDGIEGVDADALLEDDVLRLKRPGGVAAVAFSPDGKTFAAGGAEKSILVWNIGRIEPDRVLAPHQKEVLCLAFSPDGKRLASGSLDRRVRVFDVNQSRPLHTLSGHEGGVYSVAFSPDGKLLVSGGADLSFRFWDPVEGKAINEVVSAAKKIVKCQSDDQGRLYFSFGKRGPDGKPLKLLMRGFYGLAFSPDGKLLLATQEIPWGWMAWNVAEGTRNNSLLKRLQFASSAAFSPDGKVLAWTYAGGKYLLAKTLATGEPSLQVELPKSFARWPCYSSDGQTLAVLAGEGKQSSVYLIDAANGKVKRTIDCPKCVVTSIALCGDGQYLAAASDEGVLIWFLQQKEVRSGET